MPSSPWSRTSGTQAAERIPTSRKGGDSRAANCLQIGCDSTASHARRLGGALLESSNVFAHLGSPFYIIHQTELHTWTPGKFRVWLLVPLLCGRSMLILERGEEDDGH